MSQHRQTVLIQNRLGLHARAAMKLVELAQLFDATLTIENQEGKQVTANSVMGLLMLESAQGQYVTMIAEGDDSKPLLDAACKLVEHKFDEGD